MNLQNLIKEITKKLELTNHQDNYQKAWWIVETVTKKTKSELIAKNELLSSQQILEINFIINRHINEDMPLQYLIGFVPFLDSKILVKPPVLIPRPETENWCAELIIDIKNLKNKKIKILDIGAGSGCIAIVLAKVLPESEIYAIDISDEAITLTQKNINENEVNNIKLIKSDLFEQLKDQKFDLIISNPPYINSEIFDQLDNSVKNWEDPKALICEENGLKIIKKIIEQSSDFLKINEEFNQKNLPQLILEIDFTQAAEVYNLMRQNNFFNIQVNKDLQQKERVIKARRFGGNFLEKTK